MNRRTAISMIGLTLASGLSSCVTMPTTKGSARKLYDAHIREFEGFYSRRYYCAGGHCTIGYGFTRNGWKDCEAAGFDMGPFPTKLSRDEADKILDNQIYETYSRMVKRNLDVDVSKGQFLALVSFAYNCGEGALKKLIDKPGRLNDGNYKMGQYFMQYTRARGRRLAGLVRRRKSELQIWYA